MDCDPAGYKTNRIMHELMDGGVQTVSLLVNQLNIWTKYKETVSNGHVPIYDCKQKLH